MRRAVRPLPHYMWSPVNVVSRSASPRGSRQAEGTRARRVRGGSVMSTSRQHRNRRARPAGRRRALYPSVVSGLVLGVVGCGRGRDHRALAWPARRAADATVVAAYAAWFVFFLIGIGRSELPRPVGAGAARPHARGGARAGRQGPGGVALLPLLHRPQGRRDPVPGHRAGAVRRRRPGLVDDPARAGAAQARRCSRPRPTTRSSACTGS